MAGSAPWNCSGRRRSALIKTLDLAYYVSLTKKLIIIPYVTLSVCLSVCPSVCLSVRFSVYLPVCIIFCLSLSLSVCLPVYLSLCLSLILWVSASVHTTARLSSTCLYLRLTETIYFPKTDRVCCASLFFLLGAMNINKEPMTKLTNERLNAWMNKRINQWILMNKIMNV